MDLRLNLQELKTPEDIQKLVSTISEMADNLDVLVSTTAPNGNISGREGQLCLYNNSGTYTFWVCTSLTTWQQIGAAPDLSGYMLYADTRFKIGSFTRDTSVASGTQAITGVGFSPKAVIFLAAIDAQAHAVSVGVDNLTGQGISDYNGTTANAWFAFAGASIAIWTNSATYYGGIITTLGADGFTITWSKTGSPTGTATIVYLALR